MGRNLNIVHYLADHGADLNIQDSISGSSALHYAILSEDIEIIKYLLSKGVDIDVKNTI